MNDSFQKEARHYVRLRQQQLLRYTKYMFQQPLEKEIFEEGVIKDYSGGGALFESKICYHAQDILKLEMTLPGWEKYKNEFYRQDQVSRVEPIVILASVKRVEVLIPDQLYDIGVQFVGIDEGDRWSLIKQIKEQINRGMDVV